MDFRVLHHRNIAPIKLSYAVRQYRSTAKHSKLRASSTQVSSEEVDRERVSKGQLLKRDASGVDSEPRNVGKSSHEESSQGRIVASIFGRQSPGKVSLMDQVLCEGGPRFVSPCTPGLGATVNVEDLPVIVYFPGADGTGLAASRQFPSLAKSFEVQALTIPIEDTTSFEDLVDFVEDYFLTILRPHARGRPVYILGESFGAVLALALGPKCKNVVDRIVLVNPATSLKESIWSVLGPLIPQIPEEVFPFVPFAFAPFFGNPVQLLMRNIDLAASPDILAGQILEGILELFGSLNSVKEIFSPEGVKRRFKLIKQGVEYTDGKISKVKQRVLVLAGQEDWMLPSGKEAKRLEKLLPRCSSVIFEGRSHALLQEAGIDLPQIMKNEGFYVSERRLSVPVSNKEKIELNNFGSPGPIELPTEIELQKSTARFKVLESLISPVFFSKKDGEVVQGLGGLPSTRPIVFIGNHQFMGLDTSFLIIKMLKEKDILLRGLAHPIVSQTDSVDESLESDDNLTSITHLLTTFGAVPVTGKNFYKLLKQNENILLYPGGSREALKLRDEKYQVIWPEKSEFVRMASRFGATIIPLASVGVEETTPILLDSQDLLKIPFVGDYLTKRAASYPQARKGVSASDDLKDTFIQPINGFGVPQRIYFLMQEPIQTFPSDYNDKEKCNDIYTEVKSQLEEGLSYLIEKREDDPYRDFVKRVVFETSRGEQAPTFKP